MFAQLGRVAHATAHLKADPHSIPSTAQLCGECLSFAPLQNMAGDAPTVILAVTIAPDHALEGDSVAFAPRHVFHGFRSRAPPTLL